MNIGLFACYPLFEVLTPCAYTDGLQRVQGPVALSRRPACSSFEFCHSSLDVLHFWAFSFLCFGEVFTPSLSSYSFLSSCIMFTPLNGGGWATGLCNILKDFMFSSPLSLGGRLKEVFLFLQKPCYFDKVSGLQAASPEIKPPQKWNPQVQHFLVSENINY